MNLLVTVQTRTSIDRQWLW